MRTIHYLIDLVNGRLVNRFEGWDGEPPQDALELAQRQANETGHAHTLAVGKLFFQDERPKAKLCIECGLVEGSAMCRSQHIQSEDPG